MSLGQFIQPTATPTAPATQAGSAATPSSQLAGQPTGVETQTQAQPQQPATGSPAAEGTETEVRVSALRESLSDIFNIPEDLSDDEFKQQLAGWYDRANLLKDDEDIERLRQEAEQFRSISPQLTEFQKWQQQQTAATQAEQQSKWKYQEVSPYELSLVAVNDNGRYVPKDSGDPASVAAASKANQRLAQRQQMAERFMSDPQSFIIEASKDYVAEIEKKFEQKLAEIEQKFAPIGETVAVSQRQAEFDNFIAANRDLLIEPDESSPQGFKWTKAADVFGQKFHALVQKGVDEETAKDVALEFAKLSFPQTQPSTPQPQAPVAPQQPVGGGQRSADPKRVATRAIDIAKQVQPNSGGAHVSPTGQAKTLAQLVKEGARQFASRVQ